jgi:hypothetical protein
LANPVRQGISGLFSQFKLDGAASFLLDHDAAILYSTCLRNICNPQGDEITAAQFAVNRQVE